MAASPEWPHFLQTYLHYRADTYARYDTTHADLNALVDSLEVIAERIFAAIPADHAAAYAIAGSQNQDYRGMFMDGEVGVLLPGPAALVPLVDLVFMAGTVTWVTSQEALDRLLHPRGEMARRVGRATKDGL